MFEQLLVDLHEANLPKVLSWEDGSFNDIVPNIFNWRAKFSSSQNFYNLHRKISEIISYLPKTPLKTMLKI